MPILFFLTNFLTFKNQKPLTKTLFRIFFSASIFGLIFYFLPLSDVWNSIRRISFPTWSMVLVLFLFLHFIGTLKWRLLIRLGKAKLSIKESVRCYFAGLFANLFLPSLVGGDILRAGIAMRSSKRKTGIIFGSLLDRIIDVLSLCLLVICAGGLTHNGLRTQNGNVLLFVLIMFIVGVVCAISLLIIRPSKKIPKRIRFKIQRIRLGFRKLIREPYYAVAAFCLSIIIQTGFVLTNIMIGKSVGIALTSQVWFLTWPIAKISAMLPISFCGFGVREAAFAGLLKPFGIEPAMTVGQSIVWETIIIAGGLLGGIIWKSLKKNNKST